MPISLSENRFSKKELLFLGFLFLFSIFTLLSTISEPFKYLKYSLPLVVIFTLVVFGGGIGIQKRVANDQRFAYLARLLVFYIAAVGFNFFKGFQNARFFEESYFIISPLFFALLLFILMPTGNYNRAVYLLFWTIAISFVIEKFQFFLEITSPSLLINAFLTSDLPTESNFAFQLGLFLIVFMQKRDLKYVVLSAILFLFAFKRIAIAGVFVVVILQLIRMISAGRITPVRAKFLILVFNCIIVSFLFFFFAGTFDELIEDSLGVTPNFLTQGRYNIYQDIFSHFGSINILGFGLGSITTFLNSHGYDLLNLHSDVLKIFFELGPMFFIAWVYFFYKGIKTFLGISLVVYMNILFLTDNTLIYFDVMFVFYMLVLFSFEHGKEHTKDVKSAQAPL